MTAKARSSESRAGPTRIRVLVAKPGLDGHDRGAKVIARALRDAGMEVIYTGLRQSPEDIVAAAIDNAYAGVRDIYFEGAHYRRDIGARALEKGR